MAAMNEDTRPRAPSPDATGPTDIRRAPHEHESPGHSPAPMIALCLALLALAALIALREETSALAGYVPLLLLLACPLLHLIMHRNHDRKKAAPDRSDSSAGPTNRRRRWLELRWSPAIQPEARTQPGRSEQTRAAPHDHTEIL